MSLNLIKNIIHQAAGRQVLFGAVGYAQPPLSHQVFSKIYEMTWEPPAEMFSGATGKTVQRLTSTFPSLNLGQKQDLVSGDSRACQIIINIAEECGLFGDMDKAVCGQLSGRDLNGQDENREFFIEAFKSQSLADVVKDKEGSQSSGLFLAVASAKAVASCRIPDLSLTYEDWAKVVEDPFAVQDLGPNELRELLNGTDTPEP